MKMWSGIVGRLRGALRGDGQQGQDQDVVVEHLDSGTLCVGLDLPRGVLVRVDLLPEANSNGTRVRLLLRPDVADGVQRLLAQASHALRRCP